MPRRPRIRLDAVPLHIVQRGHNCKPCFFGEEDYSSYLHWLGEALGATQWGIKEVSVNCFGERCAIPVPRGDECIVCPPSNVKGVGVNSFVRSSAWLVLHEGRDAGASRN